MWRPCVLIQTKEGNKKKIILAGRVAKCLGDRRAKVIECKLIYPNKQNLWLVVKIRTVLQLTLNMSK